MFDSSDACHASMSTIESDGNGFATFLARRMPVTITLAVSTQEIEQLGPAARQEGGTGPRSERPGHVISWGAPRFGSEQPFGARPLCSGRRRSCRQRSPSYKERRMTPKLRTAVIATLVTLLLGAAATARAQPND